MKFALLALTTLITTPAFAGTFDFAKYGSIRCTDVARTMDLRITRTHLNEKVISMNEPDTGAVDLTDFSVKAQSAKVLQTSKARDDEGQIRTSSTIFAKISVAAQSPIGPIFFSRDVLCEKTEFNDID